MDTEGGIQVINLQHPAAEGWVEFDVANALKGD